MSSLRTEFLFEMRMTLESPQLVGLTPYGDRRIRYLEGGTFSGPRIQGEVLPWGADWVLLRADGARYLDVRLTLRADDGHLVYVTARGILDVSSETFQRMVTGEDVPPDDYYFRTTPLFETASEKYGWLNRVVAVTVGSIQGTTVSHLVYAIL
ncbi:MAG TPA: DUF3237 domain-containing protein [Thermoanaerobaculia bacterium]|nr:DUF3237 domain-containing protein [Thermoanaerobaculia bacterium]